VGDPLGDEALGRSDAITAPLPDEPARPRRRRPVPVSAFPGHHSTLPWPRPGTGPVPRLSNTIPHRWRKVVWRTIAKAWGDSLFRLSAEGAFWSALSTAPLL